MFLYSSAVTSIPESVCIVLHEKKNITLHHFCALLAFTILFVGCKTFTPAERTTADLVLPDAFQLYGATAPEPDQWWKAFNSTELNAMVDEALAGNFSIQQAVARMAQAAAITQQNRAALFPQLGYSTEAGVRANHQDKGFGMTPTPSASQRLNALSTLLTPSAAVTLRDTVADAQKRLTAIQTVIADPDNDQTMRTESYGLGLTASYEVDLWGRIKSNVQAAKLDQSVSREDLHGAIQSVVGQVVLTWLDLLQAGQLIEVTRLQQSTNATTLELIELRFRKGRATALDVFQQRQAIAQTDTVLPPLLAQQAILKHELAVLLGKAPRSPLVLGEDHYPEQGPLPEYGIPADLLARRPDVRTAGLRLQAADWRVSAARADRLPALSLTAGFSFNGSDVDNVFDNWLATLGSSLTGPLFDAGRRKAEVERTRAVVEERLSVYRLVVLTAVAEVENALTQLERQREYQDALRKQYDAAKNTHTEASNRYRKGLSNYLPVLTALTNMQNLERNIIQAEHDLLVFRVQLLLALGGDWMETTQPAIVKDEEHE